MQTDSTDLESKTTDEVVTPTEESTDSLHDDNGYELEEGEENSSDSKESSDDEESKSEEKTEEDSEEEVEASKTGYEDVEEDDDAEEKKEEKDEDEEVKTDLTEVIKELPESLDKDKVLKFAEDNKLSVEQVKAYAELERNAQVENEKAVEAQKKSWVQELKSDSTFGGENFDANIMKVGKMLTKHMPNFEKVLTEGGKMLPPYIMKDLLSLHKTLNPTASLVKGNPTPKVEEKNDLDEMYD